MLITSFLYAYAVPLVFHIYTLFIQLHVVDVRRYKGGAVGFCHEHARLWLSSGGNMLMA